MLRYGTAILYWYYVCGGRREGMSLAAADLRCSSNQCRRGGVVEVSRMLGRMLPESECGGNEHILYLTLVYSS